MTKNTIKDNSVGIQSGRDSNVTQYKVPEGIEKMIVDILNPTILSVGADLKKNIGAEISQSIGSQIKKVLEDTVVQPLRNELSSKNLSFHIENIKARIDLSSLTDQAKASTSDLGISKVSLIGDWFENVQNINEEEKELSTIWEEWLISLSRESKTTDYKIYLEKMKQLNTSDAKLLLKLRNGGSIGISPSGVQEYSIKKLNQLGLISRDFSINIMTIIALCGIGIGLNRFFSEFIQIIGLRFSGFALYFTIAAIVCFFLFFFLPAQYKLTRLGREIASFSR